MGARFGFLVFGLFFSCVCREQCDEIKDFDSKAGQTDQVSKQIFPKSKNVFLTDKNSTESLTLHLLTDACKKSESKWHMTLNALGGSYDVNFMALYDVINLQIGSFQKSFSDKPFSNLLKNGCSMQGERIEEQEAVIFLDGIKSAIASIYPDCNISIASGKALNCNIKAQKASWSEARLNELKKYTLQKWQRHPYLLERKIAITQQLADLAVPKELDSLRLLGFCQIIKNSAADELPVVMNSNVWQHELCKLDAEKSQKSIEMGLALSVQELEFLVKLADQTNLSANLLVNVPFGGKDHDGLWVELAANQDVLRNLADQAMNMQGKISAQKLFYWHPYFSKQPDLADLAKALGILHTEGQNQVEIATFSLANVQNYLFKTVIGETSFEVTNGRYKTLSLPIGKYKYTLYKPDPLKKWWRPNDSAQVSSGNLDWLQKRPSPQILN